MARPPNPTPRELLHISIPASDKQRVELMLYSEVAQRVPVGAWRSFVIARIREFFDFTTLDLAPYGLPPGLFVRGPKLTIELLKRKLEENVHTTD